MCCVVRNLTKTKFKKRKQVVTGSDLVRVHEWGDSSQLLNTLLKISLNTCIPLLGGEEN